MKTLTVEIQYDENMKMPLKNMKDNIAYVLNEHFKDMENYTKIGTPLVTTLDK